MISDLAKKGASALVNKLEKFSEPAQGNVTLEVHYVHKSKGGIVEHFAIPIETTSVMYVRPHVTKRAKKKGAKKNG